MTLRSPLVRVWSVGSEPCGMAPENESRHTRRRQELSLLPTLDSSFC
jgi:hypothetical protein